MDHETTIAHAFGDAIAVRDGRVSVKREDALRSEAMDTLVRTAVFDDKEARDYAR